MWGGVDETGAAGDRRAERVLHRDVADHPSGRAPGEDPGGHGRRAGRVPTVVIQHRMLEEDKPFFQKGKPGWELHPEVEGRPRDLRIEKTLPGSFTGTGLESWLREQGIDTVTIAGYMTHMCCDTTARQAVHRGFAVEFLSDATGTLPLTNSAGSVTAEELHRSILCAQQMLLSEVLPSSAWIDRVRASTTSP